MTSNGPKYYAICPACDNPVHMVNLYRCEAKTKPYAAHHKRNVKGLADFDEEAYCSCSLANPSYTGKLKERKPDSPTALAIKQEMRDNFDRILYIFEQTSGIHIGKDAAYDVLLSWHKAGGWRDLNANYFNLPYMLFYGPSQQLLGRWILKDSDIDKALSKRNDLQRLEVESRYDKKGKYVRYLGYDRNARNELRFCVFSRKSILSNEHWNEYFKLGINKGDKVIYRAKIEVDHEHLQRLKELPKHRQHRNQKLLDIAAEILGS